MGTMTGKHAIVFGVADHHSIAWGIAQKLLAEGATVAFTYQVRFEKNIRKLLADFPDAPLFECDVQNDEQIDTVFNALQEQWGKLDMLVHAVAFAGRDALGGRFVTTKRSDFATSLDISAYSLVALARRAEPLMQAAGSGSIIALTYQASQRVVPNYNLMAIAKAALEACVRYLAWDMGPHNIRVNAISPGPVRTISAMGVSGVSTILEMVEANAPLHRNVTLEDIGKLSAFLLTDESHNITGQVLYLDAGHSIMAG